MRRPLKVHIPNQLQVVRSLSVDHHGAFDRDVTNAERPVCEAGVKFGLDVFEEGAYSRERVVSVNEGA
jgi:hypothetical protein